MGETTPHTAFDPAVLAQMTSELVVAYVSRNRVQLPGLRRRPRAGGHRPTA